MRKRWEGRVRMRTSYSWSAVSEPEVAAAGADDVEEGPQRGGREHGGGEGEGEKVRRRSEDRRPRGEGVKKQRDAASKRKHTRAPSIGTRALLQFSLPALQGGCNCSS